jgi:hypothetical protein
MYDNMNNYRAILENATVATEEIEGVGTVRGIVGVGDDSVVALYDSDTQGSLEDIVSVHGSFIAISYLGGLPRIQYEYHIDETSVSPILDINPKGDLFAQLKFNPSDDFIKGTIDGPIPLANLTGDDFLAGFEERRHYRQRTIIIQFLHGFSDPGEQAPVVDIVAYTEGKRSLLGRSNLDEFSLGTLRKRVSLELQDDTILTSVTFGAIPIGTISYHPTKERETDCIIGDMKEVSFYNSFVDKISDLQGILSTPTKIYNTEGAI